MVRHTLCASCRPMLKHSTKHAGVGWSWMLLAILWSGGVYAGEVGEVVHPAHERTIRPKVEQLRVTGGGQSRTDLSTDEDGVPVRTQTLYVPAQTVVEVDENGIARRLKKAELTVSIINPDTRPDPETNEKPRYQITGIGETFILPIDGDPEIGADGEPVAGGSYSKKLTTSPGIHTIQMARLDAPNTQRMVTVSVYGVYISGQVAYDAHGTPYLTHPLAKDWMTYVGANDGDADGDLIPDFADGMGTFGETSFTGGGAGTSILVEIHTGEVIDPAKAQLQFDYSVSDPNGITTKQSETQPIITAYMPAEGVFRLWFPHNEPPAPGGESGDGGEGGEVPPVPERRPMSVAANGEWIPGCTALFTRDMGGAGTKVLLRLEGLVGGTDTLNIKYRPNAESVWTEDQEDATSVQVDLRIDSNNDGKIDDFDNAIEDCVDRIGRRVVVGNGDSDGDGLQDYFDGFDIEPAVDFDNESSNAVFAPLRVSLPKNLTGLNNIQLVFNYSASDPGGITPVPLAPFDYLVPSGHLRIWMKDGSVPRKAGDIAGGGDFIHSGVPYPTELFTANDTFTLYVEAIRPSDLLADQIVEIIWSGERPDGESVSMSDQVRITASRLTILGSSGDEGEYEEYFGLVALVFPENTGLNDSGAPGIHRHFIVRIDDPMPGFERLHVGGENVPLRRQGNGYVSDPFVVAKTRDRDLVERNDPYTPVVYRDEVENFQYDALALPDDAEDESPWSVNNQGASPVILDVEQERRSLALRGEQPYTYTMTVDEEVWIGGDNYEMLLRFNLVSVDPDNMDGTFNLVLGDGTRRWRVAVRRDRLVSLANPEDRHEYPYPENWGQAGTLNPAAYATLLVGRGTEDRLAVRLLDETGRVVSFSVAGAVEDAVPVMALLFSGRAGAGEVHVEDIRGRSRRHGPAMPLYTITPQGMLGGLQTVYVTDGDVSMRYNPDEEILIRWAGLDAIHADPIVDDAIETITRNLENSGWKTPDPSDPGRYGKEFHKKLADSLGHDPRFIAEAWISTKGPYKNMIVQIGGDSIKGYMSEHIQQVDLISLDDGYRPRLFESLQKGKFRIYELDSSIKGQSKGDQIKRLEKIAGKGRVRKVRPSRSYSFTGRKFLPARHVKRIARCIVLLQAFDTVRAVVNAAEYEPQRKEIERALSNYIRDINEEDELQMKLSGFFAANAMRQYLEAYDTTSVTNIVALGTMIKILGEDPQAKELGDDDNEELDGEEVIDNDED